MGKTDNNRLFKKSLDEKDAEISELAKKIHLPPVGAFRLLQNGYFVAKIQIEYRKLENNEVNTCGDLKDILRGQSREIDPGAYGIKPESHIRLKVKVIGGKDVFANKLFSYVPGAETIQYEITGTTLNNTLQ